MPHVSKRGLGHNIRVTSYLPVLFPVLIEFFPALFLADRIGCGSTMQLMKACARLFSRKIGVFCRLWEWTPELALTEH